MNDLTDFPNDTAEDAARLVEIVAGVYAWIQPDGSWWINNAGAVSDGDEVLIIDTCATANRTQRFLDAVQTATGDARIRVAVNTHLHGDHTYGNCLLPSTAVLVGHESMRAGLERDTLIDGCPLRPAQRRPRHTARVRRCDNVARPSSPHRRVPWMTLR